MSSLNATMRIQIIVNARTATQQVNAHAASYGTLTKSIQAANAANRGFLSSFRGGVGSLERFSKNLQWTGRQIEYNFTLPLLLAGGAAVKFALDNERAFVGLKKVYEQAEGSLMGLDRELELVAQGVRILSDMFGVNQKEVAETAAEWAQLGASGGQLVKFVRESMEFAILGNMALSDATEGLIAVQAQYKLSTEELSEAISVMNVIENRTTASMEDQITVIQRAGGTARQAGVSIRELGAMTAALVPSAGSAERAGFALNSLFIRMMAPLGRATKALKELGVNIDESAWASQTARERMFTFAESLEAVSDAERSVAIARVFGSFQAARASVLLADLVNENGQYQKAMNETADAEENLATRQRELNVFLESNPKKWDILTNRIRNAAADIGIVLLPAVMQVLRVFAQWARAFADLDPHVQKTILLILGLIAALGTGIRIIGAFGLLIAKIAGGLKFLLTPLTAVIVGLWKMWVALGAVMMGTSGLGAKFDLLKLKMMKLTRMIFGPFIGAWRLASGALGFFGAKLGLLAGAVPALMTRMGAGFSALFAPLTAVLGPMFTAINATLIGIMGSIGATLTGIAVTARLAVMGIMSSAGSALVGMFGPVVTVLGGLMTRLTAFWGTSLLSVMMTLRLVLMNGLLGIGPMLSAAASAVMGVLGSAFAAFTAFFGTSILSMVMTSVLLIRNGMAAIPGLVQSAWNTVILVTQAFARVWIPLQGFIVTSAHGIWIAFVTGMKLMASRAVLALSKIWLVIPKILQLVGALSKVGFKIIGRAAMLVLGPWGLAILGLATLLWRFRDNLSAWVGQFRDMWATLPESVGNSMRGVIRILRSAWDGIRELFKAIFNPFGSLGQPSQPRTGGTGSGAGGGAARANVPGYAKGGGVAATGQQVPGSGRGDKVPALLEPGEWIVPKPVVGALGTRFFEALPRILKMQKGGAVPGSNPVLDNFKGATARALGAAQAAERMETYNLIVTVSPGAGPAVTALQNQLVALEAQLIQVNAAYVAQSAVVDQAQSAVTALNAEMDQAVTVLNRLQDAADGLSNELSEAKSELSDMAATPIEGMRAAQDAITANETAQKEFRLEILRISESFPKIDQLSQKLEELKERGDSLSQAMSAARGVISDLASTPIQGMRAMSDEIFNNEMAQKQLRLEMLRIEEASGPIGDTQDALARLRGEIEGLTGTREDLRLAGAGSDVLGPMDAEIGRLQQMYRDMSGGGSTMSGPAAEIAELQKALDELQRQGEMLDLEQALKFDPLTRQIDQLANGLTEMPFDQIISGITAQQSALVGLESEYVLVQDAIAQTTTALATEVAARDAMIGPLEEAIALLERQNEILNLEYSLTYDPLIQEIARMVDGYAELPFDQIVSNITTQQQVVNGLEAAWIAATAAVAAQQAVVDEISGRELVAEATLVVEQTALQVLGDEYDRIEERIMAGNEALREMSAVAQEAIDAAASAASAASSAGAGSGAGVGGGAGVGDIGELGAVGDFEIPGGDTSIGMEDIPLEELIATMQDELDGAFEAIDIFGPMKKWWEKFKKSFLDTFSGSNISSLFSNIGDSIQSGWNTAFEGVREWLNAFPFWDDFVAGFLPPLQSAWDTVKGWVDEIKSMLETEGGAWAETLENVWNTIAGVFELIGPIIKGVLGGVLLALGIIWNVFWPTLMAVLTPIVEMIIAVIGNVSQIIRGIVDTVTNIIGVLVAIFSGDWSGAQAGMEKVVESVLTILGGIGEAVINIFTGLFETVVGFFKGLAEGVVNVWVWLYDILVGNSIIPDLVDGIVGWFANLFEWLGTIWENIKGAVVDVWNAIAEFIATTWDAIKSAWDTVIGAITSAWTKFWDEIKSKALGLFKDVYDFLFNTFHEIRVTFQNIIAIIKGAWNTFWDDLNTKVRTIWDGIKSFIAERWTNLKSNWDTTVNAIKSAWDTFWTNVDTKARAIWDGIKSFIATTWTNLKSNWDNAVKNIKDAWDTFWGNIDTKVRTIWDGVSKKIKEVWEDVKGFFTDAKTDVTRTWDELWDGITDKAETVKDTLVGAFETVRDKIKSAFENVRDSMGGIWDTIKSKMATPVNWIIDNVINGLIRGVNSVSGALGGSDILTALPNIPTHHEGGVVGTDGKDTPLGKMKTGERIIKAMDGEEVLTENDPRHKKNNANWPDVPPRMGDGPGYTGVGSSVINWISDAVTEALDSARRLIAETVRPLFQGMADTAAGAASRFGPMGAMVGAAGQALVTKGLDWLAGTDADIESEIATRVPALRPRIGWEAMLAAITQLVPQTYLMSGPRSVGGKTATGGTSYHGMPSDAGNGRAIDIGYGSYSATPTAGMDAIGMAIRNNYMPITKELIYSRPDFPEIRNGANHDYTGITRSMHYNHVHWAMGEGGIVTSPTYAQIGESGPEAVLPLRAFMNPMLERMASIVAAVQTLQGVATINSVRWETTWITSTESQNNALMGRMSSESALLATSINTGITTLTTAVTDHSLAVAESFTALSTTLGEQNVLEATWHEDAIAWHEDAIAWHEDATTWRDETVEYYSAAISFMDNQIAQMVALNENVYVMANGLENLASQSEAAMDTASSVNPFVRTETPVEPWAVYNPNPYSRTVEPPDPYSRLASDPYTEKTYTTNEFHGDLVFPNVTSGDDAKVFIDNLKALVD